MVDDPIPISALNQYAYCPRRCYLIHAEGEFEDNIHTLRGTFEHERVDSLRHEVSAGVRVEYGLPVWSDRLGLNGRCDAVEFHPDGSIYPVEYKHGKRRRWFNDDLQLAAQAMCLEEMLQCQVHRGAIYHQQSRRRREVVIDEALRKAVEDAVRDIRRLLARKERPPLVEDRRRCSECSLHEVCQPELSRAAVRLAALKDTLFEPQEELP
ncbi:MAG: CRISPR-associated protein Cas4 [Chromatiales bacterium]